MSGVARHSPARGRPASRLPLRLILGLALLHGCGHAASDESNGGLGAIDVAERVVERMEGIGKAVAGDVAIVVEDCDVKADGTCGESGEPPGQLATGVGGTTKLVDVVVGEAVDEAAGLVANVGECSGKRFKKCR